MARTKNACVPLAVASAAEVVVSQTINDEVVVASAVEVDSEATNSISNDDRADSDEETEALQPLKMYFGPSEYTKPFKITAKCYLHKAVGLLETHLKESELKWFLEHPQFKHFFHMHKDPNHKVMGMWLLFLRTTCLDKKKEVWFIVNGVPIRYSLEEFALMSGLYCHNYPKPLDSLGCTTFAGKMFGLGATVQYLDVENKLLSMKKPSDARLRVAVLYFLCSVIVGKGKTGPNAPNVEKFFLRAVADLELCKTFPWGRFAFEKNVKDIFYLMKKCNGVVGPQKVFPSFVMPLEYLAFEAIPVLRENFCEDIESADPQCPRMCKMKFKSSTMKGFPMSDVYDKLGTTKDIQSILAPTPDEKLLLERIMDKECGVNDVDDLIADGWKKRLVDEERTICFEPLFNEDVAHRSFVANKAPSTVVKAPRKAAVEKKGKGKAAAALTSPSDEGLTSPSDEGLTEVVNEMKNLMENGFKSMNKRMKDFSKKYEEQDKRLKLLEAAIKSIQSGIRTEDACGSKEIDDKENELEEGSDAETEIDKEVAQGDKEREVGETETEIDKEVVQCDSDKEVAESEIGVAESEKDKEVPQDDEMDGGKVAESDGEMDGEKDKEVPEDDEMDGEKEKEVAEPSEIGMPESEKDIEVADSEKEKEVPQDAKVAEPSKKRGKAHEDGDDPSEEVVKKPKVVKKLAESRTDAKPVYRSPTMTRYRRKKTKKNV